MLEKLLEIEESANTLESLTLILMTCAEKGDLPAEAYVETLGLANMLVGHIRERVEEAIA